MRFRNVFGSKEVRPEVLENKRFTEENGERMGRLVCVMMFKLQISLKTVLFLTLVICVILGSMPGEYWIRLDRNHWLSKMVEVDDQLAIKRFRSGELTEIFPVKTVIHVQRNSKVCFDENRQNRVEEATKFAIKVSWPERLLLWWSELSGEVRFDLADLEHWRIGGNEVK